MNWNCDSIVDLSNLPSQWVFRSEVIIKDSTIDKVFGVLSGDEWTKWFPGMSSLHWKTEKPYGVGTKRSVVVKGITFNENFICWDENNSQKSRFAFRFESISLPIFNSGVEDYIVENLPDSNDVHFTYLVYLNMSCFGACVLNKKDMAASFQAAAESLKVFVQGKEIT